MYRRPEDGVRFERYVEGIAEDSNDVEMQLVAQKIIINWLRAEKQRVEDEQMHDPWDLPWPTDANGDTIWPQRSG